MFHMSKDMFFSPDTNNRQPNNALFRYYSIHHDYRLTNNDINTSDSPIAETFSNDRFDR